ncbi:MAG: radical SAM protein [Parcubacteria group bacterium]|nr:radical SAM protein [Parcubacteria group bacterium]
MFTGIEMKIEITNRCLYGRCKFCSPLFRPTVQEAEVRGFLENLEQHLNYYLMKGGRRILLTGGGEPIDAPDKLFGALELINRKKTELGVELDLLTVYTNGVSMLNKASPTETFLDVLIRLGVRDINLSIHGGTMEERSYTSGKRMGRLDVDRLIPEMVRRGVRVMTRTTLTKGGIDSVNKIDAFAGHMDTLGVHIAYFSDLFQMPVRNEQTVPGSKTVLKWTDEHRVAFDDLLSDIRSSGNFELLTEYTRHNSQGRTFEFRRRGYSLRIMLGDLVIGNESTDQPTYAYVKPDGSMAGHNNARDASRQYVPANQTQAYLRQYRPGRDDI